jgi:hypothetical protein
MIHQTSVVNQQIFNLDHLTFSVRVNLIGTSTIESEVSFVQATNVEISSSAPVVKEELFDYALYVMKFHVPYSPIP